MQPSSLSPGRRPGTEVPSLCNLLVQRRRASRPGWPRRGL
jgi:hypothetical protein